MTTLVFPIDVPSSLTADEAALLAELADGRVVLELGAFLGRSTIVLAQTALSVHTVDWFQGDPHAGEGDTLPAFLANLDRYGVQDQVVVHMGRFEDVLPALCPAYFDLVFVDGFHTREAVERDLVWARAAAKPDGVIACHDYGVQASSQGGGAFGVTEAVERAFPEQERELVGTLCAVHF